MVAIEYLSDFALLIRKRLDCSFKGSITIKEEVEFLNLYIELENKGFDYDFIVDYSISKGINQKTQKYPLYLFNLLL